MSDTGERRHARRTTDHIEDLSQYGIKRAGHVYWNLHTAALYEESLRRREGHLAKGGPLVVRTGQHTGRSPNDKFIVKEPSSEKDIWWGDANRPIDEAHFERLHRRVLAYLQGKDLFVQDCFVGADSAYRHPIRVIGKLPGTVSLQGRYSYQVSRWERKMKPLSRNSRYCTRPASKQIPNTMEQIPERLLSCISERK